MKKGFTLIELLAVIVILAIIALIAAPIVLGIIKESKKNSILRSAEIYVKAARVSVTNSKLNDIKLLDGDYNILPSGNLCLEYTANECTEQLTIKLEGDVPESGIVTITNGEISSIKVMYAGKTIITNRDGKLVYENTSNEKNIVENKTLNEVCSEMDQQPYASNRLESGYKYLCKVDPSKPSYTFFVLSTVNAAGEIITEATIDKEVVSVNLIMDRNINSDGTPVTEQIGTVAKNNNGSIYNIVEWISKEDYGTLDPNNQNKCWSSTEDCILNEKGPLTAMKFVQEATASWTEVNTQIVNKFNLCDWDGTCTDKPMVEYIVNARMPYANEISKFNDTFIPSYACENLDNENINSMRGFYAYWTLSGRLTEPSLAWNVYSHCDIVGSPSELSYAIYGIRPVINLKL